LKNKRIALILFLAIATTMVAGHAYSYTGSAFGPRLYFAPYYFPKSGCCKGICYTPADFRPTYEDPNPPVPGLPQPPRFSRPPVAKWAPARPIRRPVSASTYTRPNRNSRPPAAAPRSKPRAEADQRNVSTNQLRPRLGASPTPGASNRPPRVKGNSFRWGKSRRPSTHSQ